MNEPIIKIRGNNAWGTAFAVRENGKIILYTAAHVLKDIGLSFGSTNGTLEMCDGRFYCGSKSYNLSNLCVSCDVASFDSNFQPQQAFDRASSYSDGTAVTIKGYLFQNENPREPDCGVVHTLKGKIINSGKNGSCPHVYLSLDLCIPELELHGMSGSPVIVTNKNQDYVVGLLNGAKNLGGGNPFIATVI